MARLILTDEEKAAKNWIDVSDDCLGKVCRKTMLMVRKLCEQEDGKKGLWFASCANLLISLALEANSDITELEISNLHVENTNQGDWRVTIKRIGEYQKVYESDTPTTDDIDMFVTWAAEHHPHLDCTFCSDNHTDGFYKTETQNIFGVWWAGYKSGCR